MLSAEGLYGRLLAAYGRPPWWSEDAYTVMFQAVLVQNTAWTNVKRTCAAMGGALSPDNIAAMGQEELEGHIRPCGFCKGKARTVRALTEWYARYGYSREALAGAPTGALRAELLGIRGVGEETADVILLYAFRRAVFVVDAYTRRILARMGHGFASDAEIRAYFAATLPAEAAVSGALHWLLLELGIRCCKKTPRCEACPLAAECKKRI